MTIPVACDPIVVAVESMEVGAFTTQTQTHKCIGSKLNETPHMQHKSFFFVVVMLCWKITKQDNRTVGQVMLN